MSGESVDDEQVAATIAWSPPDEPTGTCRACGADLTAKPDEWVVITPAGGWCAAHLKSAGQ